MSLIAEALRARTFQFALRALTVSRALPDTWYGREIGRQLLRAGMGVAGNYWSACRGRSDKEFIAKLGVAADEADESVLWLMLILDGGVLVKPETKILLTEGRELRAILSKSHKTARENRLRQKKAKSPTRQVANSPTSEATP
jgi:four helix bundle protein